MLDLLSFHHSNGFIKVINVAVSCLWTLEDTQIDSDRPKQFNYAQFLALEPKAFVALNFPKGVQLNIDIFIGMILQ